jgi:hypothetical protein
VHKKGAGSASFFLSQRSNLALGVLKTKLVLGNAMNQKMTLTIVGVIFLAALVFVAYTFFGKGAATGDEIVTACVEDMTNKGASQEDAEKKCKCEVGIMRKHLDADQLEFMMVLKNADAEKKKELVTKKGQAWVVKAMASVAKAGPEIAQNCR